MRAYVGVTDGDWFEVLRVQPNLDEVNFWQPGGNRVFQQIAPGELFLFKLHSPHNYIVGGGLFAHATILPISLAWSAFEIRNGAHDLPEMRQRVAKYRRSAPSGGHWRADAPRRSFGRPAMTNVDRRSTRCRAPALCLQ